MGKRQYRELDDFVKQKISQSMKGRSKTTSHKEHISNGLRQYWKQVPNKPFDEEELHRTTNFSSQAFLDKIIALATYAGVKYNKEKFYFDQVNDIIKSELKRNG